MVDTVFTPIGVLSYPNLFKPRAVNEESEPRFSCNLIFDQLAQQTPEYQELRRIANEAAINFFGADKMKDPRFVARLRKPFRPCTDRAGVVGYEGVENGIFISAWSKNRPAIVGPDTHEITVASDVFAGQRARLQVSAFCYDRAGNIGCSFGLQACQITKRNMPRLDGRTLLPFERSTEEDLEDAEVAPF